MVFNLDDPKIIAEFSRIERVINNLETSLKEFKDIKEEKEANKKFQEILIYYETMNDSFLWIPQQKKD